MSEPEGFGTDLIREKDQAEIRELIAENANLRGYAQHISPCATVEGWTVCTCGLDAVLKEAAEPAVVPPDLVSGQLAYDVGQVLDELVDMIDVAANDPRLAMMGHIVAISEIVKGDSPPAAEPAGQPE